MSAPPIAPSASLAARYRRMAPKAEELRKAKDAHFGKCPTWTVMIFMGVSNFDGQESLEQAAKDDLAEIADIGGGGQYCLNICVQQNFGGTKAPLRTHFGGERSETVDAAGQKVVTWKRYDPKPEEVTDSAETDYRDGRALAAFISDSVTKSGHRQNDHSLLVLWGHAYDFTFGKIMGPYGGTTALNFTAIGTVLQQLQKAAEKSMDPGDLIPGLPMLDILAFDACDIATAELAYQVRKVANFFLASQIGIPLPGFPYHRILDRLKEPKGDLVMSPAELGSYAVRRYCDAYDASSPVSLTMLNLVHAEELFRLTQDVAIELAMAIENPDTRDRMDRVFMRSQTELGKPFVDVADLCLSLLDEVEYPGLVEKARVLGDFVAGSRSAVDAKYEEPNGWPLVVDHDRNSGELVRLNGVSLYAPNVAPPDDPDGVASLYRRLDFVRHGRWSGVAHRLAPRL